MSLALCFTLIEQCLCGYWLALLSPPALLRQVCIVCDQNFIFQLKYPNKVEGLTLINPDAGQCGWVEWGYQKVSTSV